MDCFIGVSELTSYGVPEITVKVGCAKFRKGKSKSWENIKDPDDRRKILINLDSIPDTTRNRYCIPSAQEYKAQQKKEIEKAIEREQIQLQLNFEKEEQFKTITRKRELHKAYNSDWMSYYSLYRERYNFYDSEKRDDLAARSAREHAYWLKVIELSGTRYKAFYGVKKEFFEIHKELEYELPFNIKITTLNYFGRFMKRVRLAVSKNKNIVELIANNKRTKRPERMTTNDFHRAMATAFLTHPKQYSYRLVTELINHHCQDENQPEITESWIKWLMSKDNHFRTMVESYRKGAKYTTDNLLAHAVRNRTPFPGNVWMIDGSPVQFYCLDEKNRRTIRVNLFVIIDVCTRKILGFDVSTTENRYNIMNALEKAVKMEGHIPAEIVSDNFSAAKTEEIIELKRQLQELGCVWRHAKVGNPQDKSYVERFFGSWQSVICSLQDDYIGEGIKSKRDNRPNEEFLALQAKKYATPTFNQMKDRIIKMIYTYNELTISERKAPILAYRELPKPNVIAIEPVKAALMFWKATAVTVKRGMIKFEVKKIQYEFEVYSNKLKAELQGKKVRVRYNENEMDSIMLFEMGSDMVICECKRSLQINIAAVDRTEEDEVNTYKIVAKNESYKKYLANEKQKILDKGLSQIKKDSLDLVHPLSLDKYKLNDMESLEGIEMYRRHFGITEEDEVKPRTEPLTTVYKSNKAPVDYEGHVEIKELPLKGSLNLISKTSKNEV